VSRGRFLVRFALATATLAAAAGLGYWAGSSPRTSLHGAALADPPPATELYVPAQPGPLTDTWDATVVVRRRHSVEVTLQTSVNAQRAVVSALPSGVDDRLHPGELVVELSGRPVIALPGEVPAYRDLGLGDEGTDVRQLRAALCVIGVLGSGCDDAPDDFDVATARALEALYLQLGYSPPRQGRGPGLPATEVLYVPRLPAVIDRTLLRVGMDAEDVKAPVGWGRLGFTYVDGSAPPPGSWSGRLEHCAARGMKVRDGRLLPAGWRPGHEFTQAICQVELTTSSGNAKDWVIPLTTVWTDSGGRSLVTVRHPDGTDHVVGVELLGESHGRALVHASEDLRDSELRVMVR